MTSTWIITTTPQISALLDLAHRASSSVTVVTVGDVAVCGADSVVSVPLPDGTPRRSLRRSPRSSPPPPATSSWPPTARPSACSRAPSPHASTHRSSPA